MTCRLYIDEVGNADLKGAATNTNVRYLSLTGIITKRAAHDRYIQRRIDRLKDELFGHAPWSPVILHRRELVRREGPFAVLHDPDVRAEFDARCLSLIRTLPYIAITVAIDKKEHLERYAVWHYDPYHYCLRCLVERYVYWLRRHNLQGDVVVEPRYKLVDKKLKSSFQRIWEHGTEHLPARMVQRHLTSREIKFAPKTENCAGIQLCDLIAHPSYRTMRRTRLGEVAALDFGTEVVRILEEGKSARHPVTGVIDGWGRKWLP